MEDILFQITKDQLETGLRGFPVGYCTTSHVDSVQGVFYSGKPISELCNWPAERVIYLLYHGKEGSSQDIIQFSRELKKRSHCSHAVIKQIENLPRQGSPMKLFSAALLILGMIEGQGDYREDCLNLIAKIPHLVAIIINYHAGWGQTPDPDEKLGYVENFATMLQVPDCDKEQLTEVLRLLSILLFDHGGGNLSAFVGKAVASGHEDMYGAISSAMSALAGSLHGMASQNSLTFVQSILEKVEGNSKQIEPLIRQHLKEKNRLFGFGHAVLRVEDPRATELYDYAEKHFPDHPLVRVALLLRTEGIKILKEEHKVSDPYPNVDAMSGVLLSAAGFDYPEYFTVLFGLSRIIGIAIQIVYERCLARGGKGTPIIRPNYLYRP